MDLAAWITIGGLVTGLVGGSASAALITVLANRKKNKVETEKSEVERDGELLRLFRELKADFARLQSRFDGVEADFAALTWSVRQEPYDVAERITSRAHTRRQQQAGGKV